MKPDAGRAALTVFLTVALLFNASIATANGNEFQVEFTVLTVYRDGLVEVTQIVVVNETYPSVTLPLLATSVENIIVVDENRTALDYEMYGSNLTVYSLGAKIVELEYDTTTLTLKEAELWTLVVDTPYNLSVFLPEGSIIMYLSDVPTSIDTEDNKIKFSLFPGSWEISYELPILSPADFRVSELKITPAEVKVGEEVTVSATVTNIGGETGFYTISLKINEVTEGSETVTLGGEESTTVEFRVIREDPGTYSVRLDGLVGEFKIKEKPSQPFPYEYIAIALIMMAAAVFVPFVLLRRRRPTTERLVKTHPYLRQEDKDVIQFLMEKGGKAFEAEIRERFPDMPRTSLWRLVKRLEKMEIVKVRRIGLENQVELRK